jgi:hypothetical protein
MSVFLLSLLSASAATPAMVTTTNGEVKLVKEGKADTAPAAPFLLTEDMQLQLGNGAHAVVLYNGTAKRVLGPATTSTKTMEGGKAVSGAGKAGSMLDDLLAVQHSQAQAGAHRGGIQLHRPVPGTDVVAVKDIRWACEKCGEQEVQVVDFLAGETVWTGKGTGSVAYDGPALTGDTYQIAVGDERFTIYIANAEKRKLLDQATEAAEGSDDGVADDAAAALSVKTALYTHVGFPTEALYLVDAAIAEKPDDASLVALRDGLEAKLFPNE